MDAVEFIRERNRMCKQFSSCAECPANGVICGTIGETNDAESLVQIVGEWAKEHPHKARQSEFWSSGRRAQVDKDGILFICPANIAKNQRDEYGGCANPMKNCPECRRRFWQQEVE